MSLGKFGLLLIVCGLAGAAFAAVTTGALPKYVTPQHSQQLSADSRPSTRSWLDQGVTALNSPAWPFGRSEEYDQPAEDDADGYAPYGYGPPDNADDGSWERRQYGAHDMMPEPLPYAHDPAYAEAEAPVGARDDAGHDAADSAAARAADAARDVRAAESTP
ncbi:hypothetical protein [Novosphingobium gossypii]|uniref:hypothetical protein n=1 Tax=Novosphingobium gossypii TaxID=1604774 RepID=UPI003D21780C